MSCRASRLSIVRVRDVRRSASLDAIENLPSPLGREHATTSLRACRELKSINDEKTDPADEDGGRVAKSRGRPGIHVTRH
jgi:hypothetical protein